MINSFTDSSASNNLLYVYEIRAFDSAHEMAPNIELVSDADIARTATAQDNTFGLRDENGEIGVGWFGPADARSDSTVSSFSRTTLAALLPTSGILLPIEIGRKCLDKRSLLK